MTRETIERYTCERCEDSEDITDENRHKWDVAVHFNVDKIVPMDLCPNCAMSLRNWWRMPEPRVPQ